MKQAFLETKTVVFLTIILIGVFFVLLGATNLSSEKIVVGNAVSSLQNQVIQTTTVARDNDLKEPEVIEVASDIEPTAASNNIIVTGSSSSNRQKVQNEKGSIEFSEEVDETKMDDNIIISDNFISVDSENAPELDKPATLTFTGLNYKFSPIILRDGEVCYDCQIKSYSNGVLVFTVPHFSTYTTTQCSNLTQDLYLNSGSWKCDVGAGVNSAKIIINNSNVELDCSGSNINGGGLGTGILVKEPAELSQWNNADGQLDLERIMTNVSSFVDSISFLSNVTIKNCVFRNFEYGANISALTDSLITGNTFDNATAILALKDSLIEGNEVLNSDIGLGVIGLRVVVRNNLIHNNVNGLGVAGFDNEVTGNNASYNSETGIGLIYANNTYVSGNIAENNKNGIALTESSYNKIINNVANNNNVGISINGLFSEGPSQGNVIENNTIKGNAEAGFQANDNNLGNLFRLLAGKPRKSHMITGNSILSNTLDNAKDMVGSEGFQKNIILNNKFLGGGNDISCSLNTCDAITGEINTTLDNVTVEVTNAIVEIKQGMKTIASFETNGTLNLSNVNLETQGEGDVKGYVALKGVELSGNKTKTLYIDKIANINWLCVKDAEIDSISAVTPNCQANDEYIVHCNGILNNAGYKCTDSGSQYVIEGLKHSGVIQYEPTFRYATLQFDGTSAANLDFSIVNKPWDNPTLLGAHSGPGTNCSGAGCWSRYIERKTFEFNITNESGNLIGTMQLDGVLLASTAADKITYTGIALMWGNANVNFVFNGTTYTGAYTIVSEEWTNWAGVIAMFDQPGINVNITQFVVNMSKALSKHEIMIRSDPKVTIHNLSNNVYYNISVNSGERLEYLGGYESIKYNLTSMPDILNRTTYVGMVKLVNSPNNYTMIYGWGKSWFNTTEGKYHRLFYGYPTEAYMPNITCTTDAQCGASSTCIDKGSVDSYCVSGPLVNGTIYDENGLGVSGVNISFYPVTNYDATLNNTNIDTLVPKNIPDTVTDANGNYEIHLPDNTIWHMVMQGSKKVDFNIFTNKTNNGQGHDTEIFENASYNPNTDFNVEGHIYHSGMFEHENYNTCYQYVDFKMFGRNRGSTDLTIRYVVENHTETGTPTDNRWVCTNQTTSQPIEGFINDTDVHYCSYNNASETLDLPADGDTYEKDYSFRVPCDWPDGKYDIHVYDNQKWGKMHKIGNFFIEDGEYTPIIENVTGGENYSSWLNLSSSSLAMYSNESINVQFKSEDADNNKTVLNKLMFQIAVEMDYVYCNINVTMDQDIEVDTNGDTITDNDEDYYNCGGTKQYMYNVTYNKAPFTDGGVYEVARVHKARLTSKDSRGKTTTQDINITVFVNEENADSIGDSTYALFANLATIYYKHDLNVNTTKTTTPFEINTDRINYPQRRVGDEYMSKFENIPSWQAVELQQVITAMTGPEYIKPICPSIAQDYNSTLFEYLMFLQCQVGMNLLGPTCERTYESSLMGTSVCY